MQELTKQKLLENVKRHIAYIRERIEQASAHKEKQTTRLAKEAIKLPAGDAIAQRRIVAHNQEKLEDLKQLYPSPYFTKCEFEINSVKKTMFFSKFSFSEENIYSWITPAAALRFENPGPASYVRPDGTKQSGALLAKEQYMIVDGHLLFYATESIGSPRELVHQEHFTRHKVGFILPEVVEQMEKAQDQVVRAHHQGPFVISGPAGSGKTTLALHRVAYLAQSPETAEFFTPETVLVLVQDQGTKEYFSHLLPELGIHGVRICTFAQWAMEILGLSEYTFVQRCLAGQSEQMNYECGKLAALRAGVRVPFARNIYTVLQKVYAEHLNADLKKVLKEQQAKKVLDRFDLTVLLLAWQATKGAFTLEKEYYEELTNGSYRKRKGSFPVQYNLMIVDEFQNYLPEQLLLMKSCLNHRLESMVYVGDVAQQTQLGTIRELNTVKESIAADRIVVLQKVYRNTKQILNYIKTLGYAVAVPSEIKEGKEVAHKICETPDQEAAYIKANLPNKGGGTIGILAKDQAYLATFKNLFSQQKNIFCLSFSESQGVEFDMVFIVGVENTMFKITGVPEQIVSEVKKIQKDLLYVALTRAMSELHILGKNSLGESVSDIMN